MNDVNAENSGSSIFLMRIPNSIGTLLVLLGCLSVLATVVNRIDSVNDIIIIALSTIYILSGAFILMEKRTTTAIDILIYVLAAAQVPIIYFPNLIYDFYIGLLLAVGFDESSTWFIFEVGALLTASIHSGMQVNSHVGVNISPLILCVVYYFATATLQHCNAWAANSNRTGSTG